MLWSVYFAVLRVLVDSAWFNSGCRRSTLLSTSSNRRVPPAGPGCDRQGKDEEDPDASESNPESTEMDEEDKELENLSNPPRAKLACMECGREKNQKKMFRSDSVLVVDEDCDVDGTRIEGLVSIIFLKVELSADPTSGIPATCRLLFSGLARRRPPQMPPHTGHTWHTHRFGRTVRLDPSRAWIPGHRPPPYSNIIQMGICGFERNALVMTARQGRAIEGPDAPGFHRTCVVVDVPALLRDLGQRNERRTGGYVQSPIAASWSHLRLVASCNNGLPDMCFVSPNRRCLLTGRSWIHCANVDDVVDLLLKVVDALLDVGVLVGLLAVLLLASNRIVELDKARKDALSCMGGDQLSARGS
ncbi:hypothetical protein B0H14DRAFT_3705837 [Mycena olivaceomarginata]|nr:hypothetical protein B0H14DRAFT_3705837 [Mycena olivaceomarginata]